MTSPKNEYQGQRIEVLDQMRGLALLGIFLMNIPGLASITYGESPTINEWLQDYLSILLSDSARPLFAFMFGVSLVLIYDRLREKELNPFPTLMRRMLFLMLVGAFHGFFIWTGDILLMYAMAGIVLLLFIKLPEKWLLIAALLFWPGFTVGMDFLSYYTPYYFYPDEWAKAILNDGEYPMGTMYLIIEFSSMLDHLGFFLFGMYAYRRGLFSMLPERRRLMWVAAFLFLAVGIAGKTGLYYYQEDSIFLTNLHDFYPFIVTIGAILIIVLWGTSKKRVAKGMEPFGAIGRMAFTNYLLQSVVFVSLFTQSGQTVFDGFGIWSEASYIFALSVGIFLFIIQMVFSHYWLRKFYYGPLEWLWRIVTHKRMVPLKRKIAD